MKSRSLIVVAMPAMTIVVVMIVHSKYAFDTADSTPDRGADDSAYRPCNPVAFMKAVHRTTRNALSLCRKRKSKHGDACARNEQFQIHFHFVTPYTFSLQF